MVVDHQHGAVFCRIAVVSFAAAQDGVRVEREEPSVVGVTQSSSRSSAVSHPGVSLFKRFCGTKTPGLQNLVFWTQNQ
jgi:hypothetical protein